MTDNPFMFPGEHRLWSGNPGGGILFQPIDFFLVPFSLLWCGMAIFIFSGSGSDAPAPFDLFGAFFVVIGLFFVFGRFLLDLMLRRSLSYTVTSRRIFIERSGFLPKSTVVNLSDAPPISLRRMRDGRGTIRFGENNFWLGNAGFGAWSPTMDPTPQLIAVDEAQRVFDLIQRAQNELLHPTS